MTSSSRQRLPLWTLLSANAVSNVGDEHQHVAIPWFVLQTTGSASKTGIVAATSAIPPIIAGVFGGTIVDCIDFKRMSILSDLASGAAVAMIPLLYWTVGLRFGELILLVFLAALFYSPGNTARQSLLPDLVQLAGVPTERANAAFNGIQRSSMLLGPPLAGVLIALFSAGNVLWIDAASFLVSAVALASVLPAVTKEPASTSREAGYFRQIGESLRFVRRDQLLLTMLVILALVNFVTVPLFDVILPVYARQVFDSAVALGIMMAGFGAGALISILIYGAIGHRLSRRITFASAFLFSMIHVWMLTMTPNLVLTTVASSSSASPRDQLTRC